MTYTVLIVDDSKLARMSINKSLRALLPDCISVEASNAAEAIACLQQSHVDAAILDFHMPTKDGIVLAAELRNLAPDIFIGIVSANQQTEVVDRARALGASFIAKPVAENTLAEFLSASTRAQPGSVQ